MRKFCAIFLLTGCAALAPVVQDVRLSDRQLTLVMSDGSTCKADWRAGPGQICGYGYQVTVDQHPNPLRQLTAGLVLALGGKGIQPPMAEVVLTDARGHESRFTLPKPVDLTD